MGKGDSDPPTSEVFGTLAIHVFPLLVAKVITSDGVIRETDSNGYIQYVKPLGTNLHFKVESEGYQPFEFDFVFNCIWWDYDVHLELLVNDNDLSEAIDEKYGAIDKNLFENAILIRDRTIVYKWGDVDKEENNLASVVRAWVNLIWGNWIDSVGFAWLDAWANNLPCPSSMTINSDMAVSNLLSYTTPHSWVYSGGKDNDGLARWPKQFAILAELYEKPCPDVIREVIFNKLGGSFNAWMISDGTMRISSSIRDLYKFARLLFNKGKWNNEQIISEQYIERTLAGGPNGNGIPFNLEGYQTHLIRNGSAWEMEDALPNVPDGFMARSEKSYIIGIPSLELIMAGHGPSQLQSVFLPQICNLMRS